MGKHIRVGDGENSDFFFSKKMLLATLWIVGENWNILNYALFKLESFTQLLKITLPKI